jgi:hypothetical protein
MIYAPLAGEVWIETRLAEVGAALVALFLGTPPELPVWPPKLAPGATITPAQVSTSVTPPDPAKTAECPDCAKLRAELSHLKLDLDFQKGETALKEDGLNELRAVLDKHDVPTGPIKARLERVCKDRDEARKRVLVAENEARTLRAQLARYQRADSESKRGRPVHTGSSGAGISQLNCATVTR